MPLLKFLLLSFFVLTGFGVAAQTNVLRSGTGRQVDARGNPVSPNATSGKDSLQHRSQDSITISFRYFDSSRQLKLDSNVLNLHQVLTQPYDYLYLGNLGSAARPILFSPRMYAGFDAGFHSYDLYQFNLAGTRFFNTTKPYSELTYVLGGAAEQTIGILFTQNFKPTYNVTFDYRFVSSPGLLKNLRNTNRALRLAIPFTTKARRYSGNIVFISNKMSAGESGGIANLADLKDSRYNDRFLVPTRLGGDADYNTNVFNSSISTGAQYTNTQLYFRHQYDFGQTDSVATDSGYVKLFYPRFRIQHNFSVTSSSYRFRDASTPDSISKYYYYTTLTTPIQFQDKWQDLKNEFALMLFPEKNNQNQFLKVGAAYQLLTGTMDATALRLYNIYLLGEYRNRTRNRRWDINASGQLYTVGFNAGDYLADIRAQAFLGNKLGYVDVGFQTSNRKPGFVFDGRSSFPLLPSGADFNKENFTHLYGSILEPKLELTLAAHYYLLVNYTYFDGYFHAVQASTPINVLRLSASKKIKLSRRWNLYSEIDFQQPTSNAIHLPAFFTHHQLAYESNFFKNLDLSTGVELRYFTPFKADDYSPLTGQFFWQDTVTIRNRPDVAAFLHMRIKSFKLFIRLENLNTIDFSNGFGFTKNNFAAPRYLTPGQFMRVGIRWDFIN